MPIDRERVESLFEAAPELAPDQRRDFTAASCGSNEAMHAAVLKLLAAHARRGGVLDVQPDELFADDAAPPARLGVFRLLQEIGRGGMRVGSRDPAVWSFLMATAHGAGLMVLPFVMPDTVPAGHDAHMSHASMFAGEAAALAAAAVHAASYLVVTCLIAVVVYQRVGLRMLRTAWINLDVLWALALIATALITPFV